MSIKVSKHHHKDLVDLIISKNIIVAKKNIRANINLENFFFDNSRV